MIKRVAIWTMVISLGEITLYARELLTDTETKNVKPLKVLESYWRTYGVQPFVRFCHGRTHSRRFAAFLKWDIWESGTILSLLLLILKFVLLVQTIDFY
ncbi:hypothetical protein FKK78_17955 [Enterobacter hormaechei]|uniref:hypothetical protein n=1 Tax=Enterobacter hormaechei TaxID=158836 RepID=UPI00190C8167|nr:hypothetical protein [Enterobacter hormaechei]MBK2821452.1 hypothetical protein [Enterobacter hormaechei]